MVKVGLIQLSSGARQDGELRPIEPAVALVDRAVASGAEFVVLPELWRSGAFELPQTMDLAEPLDGPTVTALGQLAARHGVWLHGGSFLERTADGTYNTSVVFDPQGTLVASYRKRHLFGFDDGEAALLTSGDDTVVIDTPLGATGLATCYDLRFPEHFRALLDGGAQTFLMCSGWPAARGEHWRALARARAIENQAWLVATNGTGITGDMKLAGHSCVVNPVGETQELSSDEDILIADIDPAAVAKARADFPVLRDRR